MARKKERGNGTGTVYPRKNKQGKVIGYRGSYWVNGKRCYVSAKKKTDAERALRQAMADADRGLVFDAGTLTLGEYLDKWLPNIKGTMRQRTWERYEQIARVHLKPSLGRNKLKSLTPTHVRGLYRQKLDKGSSPRTVQYIHTTLRKALRDATSDGLIPRNVTEGIKAPKPKKKEINPLDSDQAKTLLNEVHGDRLEALYILAVHRGLRQGELLGLKWQDVDLEAGILQVRRTLSLTKDGHVFEQPKNGKGRSIELTEAASEALRSHLKRQLEEIEALGDDYQD
jgi:integrase